MVEQMFLMDREARPHRHGSAKFGGGSVVTWTEEAAIRRSPSRQTFGLLGGGHSSGWYSEAA